MNTGVGPAPSRQSQVSQELDHCNAARNNLHEVIDELEKRLHPILRMDPQPPGQSGDKEAQPLVGLAQAVRESAQDIEVWTGRLRSLLSRIEL